MNGSKEFHDENNRIFIVENLQEVDKCFLIIDKDRTVVKSIKWIYNEFANGGDQNYNKISERTISEEYGIELIEGLKIKIQSFSWLLNFN